MKRKEPDDYIDENKLEECRKRIKYLPNNIQKKHETNDYLNRTNELDLKIDRLDNNDMTIIEIQDEISNFINPIDYLQTILKDLSQTEKITNVLNSLSSLNCRVAILLENDYENLDLKEQSFNALRSLDFDRFDLLNNSNLKLNNQFDFYLSKIKLKVNKRIENKKKKVYDEYGNVISFKIIETKTLLSFEESYDSTGYTSIFKYYPIPFKFFTNIINFKNNLTNIDLTNEIQWLNCQNHYEYNKNESIFFLNSV